MNAQAFTYTPIQTISVYTIFSIGTDWSTIVSVLTSSNKKSHYKRCPTLVLFILLKERGQVCDNAQYKWLS